MCTDLPKTSDSVTCLVSSWEPAVLWLLFFAHICVFNQTNVTQIAFLLPVLLMCPSMWRFSYSPMKDYECRVMSMGVYTLKHFQYVICLPVVYFSFSHDPPHLSYFSLGTLCSCLAQNNSPHEWKWERGEWLEQQKGFCYFIFPCVTLCYTPPF